MQVTIQPGSLSGVLTPPPSKSQAHRLLLAAALAPGESQISNVALSADILATLHCMEALGATWSRADKTVCVAGVRPRQAQQPQAVFNCNESGSTLRFLLPIALAAVGGGTFLGQGRLMERPQEPYFALFREKGISYETGRDRLTVRGRLSPGLYRLPGNVSSQFVTGLLYALPLLAEDSDIVLTSPLESRGYVDMTLDALALAGISAQPTQAGWHIPGGQSYRPVQAEVEADYSQAGFFCAANLLGSHVTLTGLNPESRQGDRIVLSDLAQMEGDDFLALDVSQCPDLVPALSAAAALRAGRETVLTGAARLRMKESDRLTSTAAVLNALGGRVEERPDSLRICGQPQLHGGTTVDSFGDHRIAMMAAVAATRCCQPVTLTGAESVNKSYPAFWDDFRALGGACKEE